MATKTPPSEEIIGELDSIFVEHPAFQDVVDDVIATIGLHGKLREAPNLFITGPSGIGKTTLVEKVAESFPRVVNGRQVNLLSGIEAECDSVPLLCVDMPSQPTANSLARVLLEHLGDGFWRRGGRDDLNTRLVLYTRACGVRGIIIDEAQRAVDRDGVVRREDLAEWLKEIHSQINVSFILLGMGRVRHLFDHDDQIDRRWDEEIQMPPYLWGEDPKEDTDPVPESRLFFIALLVAFKEQSPLPYAPEIDVLNEDEAKKFYYASRGVVGLLKKLLLRAMWIATRDGDEIVSADLLRRAFDKAFRKEKLHEKLINPWGLEWDGRMPPPVRDHTLLNQPKRKGKKKKSERRAELTTALTKA
ncbi:TniB family NTP-binding protein [Microvirga arabica]|uniref:TniB family NTP-binding protein n=1 Tax=Microvirga arabica TaxID=1128671 RepID=UPI00193A693C|nr:TniB family NTP-binding protein [Microvirga arabica]MBM1170605.1 TniB family NTP-binding protein [Microvirga arabica]